ncbi:tripartite tricarboxylate transporter substrate binding protein (plasmid) [Variovorax sp. V213]|uniref:Bug family tripartite tricarboxylate transporter substrate binding protein n=1 Tax=Variovorax sp. V213 TaxID=3065955 RepID=UPI0034E8DB50
MQMLKRLAGALPLVLAGAAMAAGPGGYPSKPVTVVVPFAPGGGSDNIARYIVSRLADRTKASFIIDNKPGAGTNIGNEYVGRAAPDGHTLLFGQVTLAINPFVYKTLRYNVQKDFVPVAHIADSPTVLIVTQSLPVKSAKEFVAYAKSHPETINYGSGGKGTSVHLAGELFGATTGTKMVHVPYRGSALAMTDLIGGQVQSMFDTAPSALQHVKGGKVRALAVTGSKRIAELPDTPTFAEAGISGFDAPAWYGLLAPAGTPAPIVQFLNAEIEQILKEPATRQRLTQLGADPVGGSPDEFGKFIRAESDRWSGVVRAANVTPE